jgi:FlaA1/EpsC-like NDP-sugar epimerase
MRSKFLKEFKGKTILITGGTGSIGFELLKQLLNFKPKLIKILTNDENSIFDAQRKLASHKNISYIIGDIRDKERLRFVIRNVDFVFHAAAMKHIDICEENPFEAVKTNVLGTSNIIEVSLEENISRFIFVSTDKSASPTNTLGASKMLAERLTRNANSFKGKGKTIFSAVRFGNVIGSRGSVFLIFLEQIKNKKALTVTDSQMTRFIMSIPEAAMLILEVTCIAKGGEIFVLKMPSVNIETLAKNMAKICSKRYFNGKFKSKIQISNPRKFENFNEKLITEDEVQYCYDLGSIFKISSEKNKKKLSDMYFSSQTAPKISFIKLNKIINELLDDLE